MGVSLSLVAISISPHPFFFFYNYSSAPLATFLQGYYSLQPGVERGGLVEVSALSPIQTPATPKAFITIRNCRSSSTLTEETERDKKTEEI